MDILELNPTYLYMGISNKDMKLNVDDELFVLKPDNSTSDNKIRNFFRVSHQCQALHSSPRKVWRKVFGISQNMPDMSGKPISQPLTLGVIARG